MSFAKYGNDGTPTVGTKLLVTIAPITRLVTMFVAGPGGGSLVTITNA